jgi:hypothetical protein
MSETSYNHDFEPCPGKKTNRHNIGCKLNTAELDLTAGRCLILNGQCYFCEGAPVKTQLEKSLQDMAWQTQSTHETTADDERA